MNVLDFKSAKSRGRKIVMVTAYDYWTARIVASSKVDCVLVGDSAAMVMHGHSSTLHATPEMMAAHVQAVAKGAGEKFVIGDMPFLSFRKSVDHALDSAGLLMRAGAQAVKIEGVWGHEPVIERLVQSGIPVMGHLGLTPQSVHQLGGFRVQGREAAAAQDLIAQARRLESLGCFAIVLECVPAALASEITAAVSVPTIGIGAGTGVDGQVLVLQDLIGGQSDFQPRFVRRFMQAGELMREALDRFASEARDGTFPSQEESYL